MRSDNGTRSTTLFVLFRVGWAVAACAIFWVGMKIGAEKPLWGEFIKTLGVILLATLLGHMFFAVRLLDDVGDKIKEIIESEFQPARAMEHCGVAGIFQSREEAKSEIDRALYAANNRIWIQCVAFSNVIPIDSYAPRLTDKLNAGVDVKLLLMDPLRSPAFFRAFLEDDFDHLTHVLDQNAVLPGGSPQVPLLVANPYFETRLCTEADASIAALRLHRNLRRSVRYYGHTPPFWLAIIDEIAYYQPYTFGRGTGTLAADKRLGNLMPVISCFDHSSEKAARPVGVLVRHFERLWRASETDALDMEARWDDKSQLAQRVFQARRSWFRNVHYSLNTDKRERGPRHLFTSQVPATFSMQTPAGVVNRSGSLEDFSQGGLGIVVDCPGPGQFNANGTCEDCLGVWRLVVLNATTQPQSTRHVLQQLLGPQYEGKVTARWTNCDASGTRRIGLEV